MLDGLDVLVGAESLIGEGSPPAPRARSPGSHPRSPRSSSTPCAAATRRKAGALRAQVERFPRHAALKEVVRARGVPMQADVRPPLRALDDAERSELLGSVRPLARRSRRARGRGRRRGGRPTVGSGSGRRRAPAPRPRDSSSFARRSSAGDGPTRRPARGGAGARAARARRAGGREGASLRRSTADRCYTAAASRPVRRAVYPKRRPGDRAD